MHAPRPAESPAAAAAAPPPPPRSSAGNAAGPQLRVRSAMLCSAPLVFLLLMMIPSIVVLYFASVDALEESVKKTSLTSITDVAQKMNVSFHEAIQTSMGFRELLYFTVPANSDALDRVTPEEYLNASVRSMQWAGILGSNYRRQELGVVLVPGDITTEAQRRRVLYTHVWYDINSDRTKEFVHAHHFPSDPYNLDATGNHRVTVDHIEERTQRVINPTYYNFSLDPYLWHPTWETTPPRVHDQPDVDHIAHRFRSPGVWWSKRDKNIYTFCAFELYCPRPPPPHPWHDYLGEGGGVLFQSFFVLATDWTPILNEHYDNTTRTSVWIYDRSNQLVYAAPTIDGKNLVEDREGSGTGCDDGGHVVGDTRLHACLPHANNSDEVGPLLHGLYTNGPRGTFDTEFMTRTIAGTTYYIRYKYIFGSNTTGWRPESIVNLTEEELEQKKIVYDMVAVWAMDVTHYEKEMRIALLVLVVFLSVVVVLLFVLYWLHSDVFVSPLDQVRCATQAITTLDFERARNSITLHKELQVQWFQIREISELRESFLRTLDFLQEYAKYLPTTLREQMQVGGMDAGNAGSPVPQDELLGRLQEMGLNMRVGSVLVVRLEGNPSVHGAEQMGGENTGVLFGLVLSIAEQHNGHALFTASEGANTLSEFSITWNIAAPFERHAQTACAAALDLAAAAPGDLRITIAVATGDMYGGQVGDDATRRIAVTGYALALAHGLLPIATCSGARIVMPEQTYEAVGATVDARPVDRTLMVGREVVVVYELSGRGGSGALPAALSNAYAEGFQKFCVGAWGAAAEALGRITREGDRQVQRVAALARWFDGADVAPGEYLRRWRGEWPVWERDAKAVLPRGVSGHSLLNDMRSEDVSDFPLEAETVESSLADEAGELEHCARQVHYSNGRGGQHRKSLVGTSPTSRGARFPHRDQEGHRRRDSRELPPRRTLSLDRWAAENHTLPHVLVSTNGKEQWKTSSHVLGVGGFGRVYGGMAANGELVALKRLPITPEREQATKEVVKEVAALDKLRHGCIVSYYASTFVPGTPHADAAIVICMEYMPGGSLAELLRDFGRFSESTMQRYGTDILQGLEFLHTHDPPIMHGDLKPGNVLVGAQGCCKLSDFGSCTKFNTADTGDIAGTILYMAPEAFVGKHHLMSDVWAFGLTFLELLTGKLPYEFPGGTPSVETAVYMLAIQDPPLRPTIPEDASPGARAVAAACLAADAAHRAPAAALLVYPFFQGDASTFAPSNGSPYGRDHTPLSSVNLTAAT